MSKKDEDIARLQAENDILAKKDFDAIKLINELDAKNKGLTENNQQLNNRLKDASQLKMDIEADKEVLGRMLEDADKRITGLNAQIDELSKEPLMDLTVNVAGVQDIGQTLDGAVMLIESRLETLGYGGKFKILAHPNTMEIDIVG